MRRIIGLACVLAVLILSACSTKQPDTVKQADPQPTGNLCERLTAKVKVNNWLKGEWKAEESSRSLNLPPSDSCLLVDSALSEHRIQISVSIFPVTAAQAVAIRQQDELEQREYAPGVKVVDGGVGPDSWGVNPPIDIAWLVFHTSDREIRLQTEEPGYGKLDELRTLAQKIPSLPGGIPAAPAVVERPECARGTTAAERVLGMKATVRRDAVVGGFLRCQWGTASRTVQARAGDGSSDQAEVFLSWRNGHAGISVHKVSVGTGGWQQSDGSLVFRTNQQTFVLVTAAGGDARPSAIVTLARAIAPAFGS